MHHRVFTGADRYQDNLEMMFGFRVPIIKYLWMTLTPLFTMVMFELKILPLQGLGPSFNMKAQIKHKGDLNTM